MIHGKCSHYYCGNCIKHNTSVDVLEEACVEFLKFNRYEYNANKGEKYEM